MLTLYLAAVALIAARAGYLLAQIHEAKRRRVIAVGRIPARANRPETPESSDPDTDLADLLIIAATHDTRRRIFAGRYDEGRMSA